jgi:hypothetical protein
MLNSRRTCGRRFDYVAVHVEGELKVEMTGRKETNDEIVCYPHLRITHNASTIDSFVDKEDVALEAILDKDDLIQAQNT